jgi:methylenetetrahydrofolate dehydrogenase (NADP+)/methenyltetrahydrofolate cyclohydrolase
LTAQIIDGAALARQVRAEAAQVAARMLADTRPATGPGRHPGRRRPCQRRVRAQQGQGLRRGRLALGARTLRRLDLAQPDLLARIAALNADPAIHGILVQMPLPRHLDPKTAVIEAIAPAKDVDGFLVPVPAR